MTRANTWNCSTERWGRVSTIEDKLVSDRAPTSTASPNSDFLRVTAECRGVSLDPFQCCTLIKQSSVSCPVLPDLFTSEKTVGTQPILYLDVDYGSVRDSCELSAIEGQRVTQCVASTMYLHSNWQACRLGLIWDDDIEVQAVFAALRRSSAKHEFTNNGVRVPLRYKLMALRSRKSGIDERVSQRGLCSTNRLRSSPS